MELVKVGQFRTWKADTNNEHFKIVIDDGIRYGTHYYIIKYTTDSRKQTISEEDLLKKAIVSHVYDGVEEFAFE